MVDKIVQLPMNVTGGAVTQTVAVRMTDMQDGTFAPFGAVRSATDLVATYKAVASITVPGSATDISTISGSATKVVCVTGAYLSGVQTVLGEVEALILKRSSSNSGGTSVAPVIVSMDSTDAAPTAVVAAYSANPSSLGTLVGNVVRRLIPVGVLGGSVAGTQITFGSPGKPPTLRGPGEFLALNLNGVTILGASLDIEWTWYEI